MLLLLTIFLSIAGIVIGSAKFKQHPFILLLLASLMVGLVNGSTIREVIDILTKGFGDILGSIGLIVILGCVIGGILESTGAAERIASAILKLFTQRHPSLAMSSIGALVGIPVFCDSGFVILSKLSQQVARQSGRAAPITALSLAGGLYVSHCLVPPTPGPLAVAGNLQAESHLGLVLLLGLLLILPNILLISWWSNRFGQLSENTPSISTIEVTQEVRPLPHLIASLTPLLVPVVLIAWASIAPFIFAETSFILNISKQIGHPIIALAIGILASLPLLRFSKQKLADYFTTGITQSGSILVLTGAGGAFGAILKTTPMIEWVNQALGANAINGWSLLFLAFGLAAFLKTAQGSSTSAMVIASSLLAPFIFEAKFTSGVELALYSLSIGAGAMAVSHANDSYFWVVSQFSNISPQTAYRSFSSLTLVQAVLAFLMILLLYGILV